MANKWIGTGNLGADVDLLYLQNGTAVASFSIACKERRKDQNGDYQDHAEWVRLKAFGKRAEVCAEYLSKGSKVYAEGKLQTSSWKDQEGKQRYTTEVVVSEIEFLSPRNGGASSQVHGYDAPTVGDDVPF